MEKFAVRRGSGEKVSESDLGERLTLGLEEEEGAGGMTVGTESLHMDPGALGPDPGHRPDRSETPEPTNGVAAGAPGNPGWV